MQRIHQISTIDALFLSEIASRRVVYNQHLNFIYQRKIRADRCLMFCDLKETVHLRKIRIFY